MSQIATKLRTGKEKLYGTLMIVFGAVLWIVIALVLVAALAGGNILAQTFVGIIAQYVIAIAIIYFVFIGIYRATAFGNMILLGPQQFPALYAMVVAASQELGMKEPPRTFLYNSNGLVNAFARRLFGGRYVFLTSALVEATSDEQVRFVIGHELGHHAAGHLNPWMNFLKLPAHAVPFLPAAYSRSREYTCDRIGAHVSKDLAVSHGALQMLGCGCRRLNHTMNAEAFMAQEAMVPGFFGFISEIFRSHPRLTRRLAALGGSGSPATIRERVAAE